MIQFRKAQADDFQRIAKLKKLIHADHVRHAPEFYKELDQALTPDEYDTFLDPNGKRGAYVLLDDSDIVGYAFTELMEIRHHPLIRDHRRFFLDDICVDASVRGRGHGKRLMKEMQRIAEEMGCQTIELDVWDWNKDAIEFYRTQGMQFTRHRMKKDVAASTRDASAGGSS